LRQLKPQEFWLRGRIGFDEPHYTAWCMAAAGIINGIMPNQPVSLIPVWGEECYDIEGELKGRLVIAVLLRHILKYCLSSEVRKHFKYKSQPRTDH